MYFVFSRILALAFLLPFSTTLARVTNPIDSPDEPLLAARAAHKQYSLLSHLRNVFSKREEICVKDDFFYYLQSNPEANTFCNVWISIPPATKTVDYTSTITAIDITATLTNTIITIVRTTTVLTVTTTEIYGIAIATKQKREATPSLTNPPILPRNALLNGIAAIVTDVISGIGASSADMPAGTAKASIDAGLSSACSCLDYQPLSTSTITYTNLPYFTTLEAFEQDTVTLQSTIVYTSYITQTTTQITKINFAASTNSPYFSPPLNSTVSAATSASAGLTSTRPAVSVTLSSFSPATVVSSTISTLTPVGLKGGPGRPSSEARAIATSLPISCPQDNNQTMTNIVGNERFEYLILCNVNVLDNTTILSTSVAGPTECAAECSFVNDAFQEDFCQSAIFIPTVVGHDNCLLKKSAEMYSQAPGYVSVILLNTFTGGNNSTCSTDGFAGASSLVDTSSLIASIASSRLSVTQPPYVVSSGGGGHFSTYFSHGEFDSMGVYHYSWNLVEAASSSWYVIYPSSWKCTIIHSQTIVIPHTVMSEIVGGSSIATIDTDITTIIYGYTTTIIDHGSTTIITDGYGQISVPASVTSGGGVFSIGGASSIIASQGGSSVVSPATMTASTETITSVVATATVVGIGTAVSGGDSSPGSGFSNATSVVTGESVVIGTGGEATSGGFYTHNSTGGSGVVSSLASAPSTSNETTTTSESVFVVTSVAFGMTSFYTSTGALGVVSTASSGLTTLFPSLLNGPTGTANQTVIVFTTINSGLTSEYTSTGGFGVISRTSGVASASISSSVANETIVTANQTIIVYTTVISGASSTYLSTGRVGVIGPGSSLSINPTSVLTNGTFSTINESVQTLTTASSGFFSGGTSGSFFTMNSTGSIGAITPTMSSMISSHAATLPAIPSNGTTLSKNETALISRAESSGLFSGGTSGGFSTMNSTGGIRAITPILGPSTMAPAVPSIGTSASMNETILTSTYIISGGFSSIVLGSIMLINSTGGAGVISPTSSPSVTVPPIPSNGTTSSINETALVSLTFVSGVTTVLNSASGTGIRYLPSDSPSVTSNSTTSASPELTTSLGSAPPSMTPAPSPSTSSSFTFGDNNDSRNGPSYNIPQTASFSTSNFTSARGIGAMIPAMTPSGTAYFPSLSNSTIASTGPPIVSNNTVSSESPLITPPDLNSTFVAGTQVTNPTASSEIASATLSPFSGNGTMALPTAASTSTFTFIETGPPRIGSDSSEISTPTPFANSTMPMGTGSISALPSSSIPAPYSNSTIPSSSGSVPVLLSTSNPTPSTNSTIPLGTGLAPPLSSTSAPVMPENSKMPLSSGSALTISSTSIYPVSIKSTTQLGTVSTEAASLTSFVFGNSTAFCSSSSISALSSISIPLSSANSTAPFGTDSTVAIALAPLPSSSMPSSSGNASINVNSTSLASPSLITDVTTSTPPSATPTVSSDATSSSECGGSATLSTETVFITHTVPASTCTSTGGFSFPTYGSISTSSPSANSSTWSKHRVIGEVATQAQINAACANNGNIIFNGDFEIIDDRNNVIGWDSYSRSSFIDFEEYPSTTQPTLGGSYNGRVVSMDPGASISIWQPVTLCLNTSYYLEAWDRQYPLLAECVISYALDNQTLFSTSPQESWNAHKVIYTAGETAVAVSLTFNITVTCHAPSRNFSEDADRKMIAEIDDLGLIAI